MTKGDVSDRFQRSDTKSPRFKPWAVKRPAKESNFLSNMQTCNCRHNYVKEYLDARLFRRVI